MILHLRARPNARANQFLVAPDGTVTVRLKAPPQEGQANAVLLAYLAEVFGTSKSRVELVSGHTAPFKKVALLDVNEAQLAAVLARHRAG
ncbi:DUF167 family protein [Hymenobacter antarcticus]|uniref:UPF0235 protein GCM10022407_36360 n=1 Tax=Hymenobacter antarcticus TaxID=486270 RepID=A0ABP7QUY1_9BACT